VLRGVGWLIGCFRLSEANNQEVNFKYKHVRIDM